MCVYRDCLFASNVQTMKDLALCSIVLKKTTFDFDSTSLYVVVIQSRFGQRPSLTTDELHEVRIGFATPFYDG